MEAVDLKLTIPVPFYWGSNVLAVLLLVSSISGLTLGPRGFYAPDPGLLPQILGHDLITLIIGVPSLLGCVKLSQKGSLRGTLLWTGWLFYFAYAYYFYGVEVRFNALFLAYIAIVAISLYSVLGLLFTLQAFDLGSRLSQRTPRRAIGLFFLFIAGVFTCLWVGLLLSRLLTATALSPMERQIMSLNGIVLIPLLVMGGWLLLQRRPWGYLLAGTLLTQLAALGFTRLVSTGLLVIWQQPVDGLQTLLFATVMVGALMGLVAYLDGIMTPVPGPSDQIHST